MRKNAFSYFKEQPGFHFSKGAEVRNKVMEYYLCGYEADEIFKEMLNKQLMIDSVKRFKSYVLQIVETDIDSEKNTKDILLGFYDYIVFLCKDFDDNPSKYIPEFLRANKALGFNI